MNHTRKKNKLSSLVRAIRLSRITHFWQVKSDSYWHLCIEVVFHHWDVWANLATEREVATSTTNQVGSQKGICTHAKRYWHNHVCFHPATPAHQLALCSTAAVSQDLTGGPCLLGKLPAKSTNSTNSLVKLIIHVMVQWLLPYPKKTAGSQEFPTHGQPKDWLETMDFSRKERSSSQAWG